MPLIQLQTIIHAPIERCFDLSRSVDLHLLSTEKTGEEVIAGKMQGLMKLNDFVTWRARHLGFRQCLTAKITAYTYPSYFCDEMVKGAFRCFRHEHHFKEVEHGTEMLDLFAFESPLGYLGKVFNQLFLTNYMTHLLIERNRVIKEFAESEKWRHILR